MLEKFAFLSAVVLLPFAHKGSIRGDRAFEPRPPSQMPVEDLGPFPRSYRLEESPRLDLPLAAPIGSANKAGLAVPKRLPIQAAISLYLSEIQGYVGDAVFEVAWLAQDYARFRNDSPNLALPTVTPAHLSRCLTALGHERLRRDGRHQGGDGRRAVLFYIKAPRNARRAAA